MRKIVVVPQAAQDIRESLEYLTFSLASPQAAMSLSREIRTTARRLQEFPYAHELYRGDRPTKEEIRKVPVKGYVLYYVVYEDRVEIRRFLRGRRDRSRPTGE